MKKSIFLFFAAILCAIGMNAATQRYVYVGLSNNYHKWKNSSQWGINHWGGTGGGVLPGSKITDLKTTITYSNCTFHMYRMYVYDDNKNFEFKGSDNWWDCKKENISISGTTKNALLFRDNDGGDGGSPTFYQTNYQEESAVSLSASSNSVSVGEEVTLTPKLTSNAEYNEIASTTYSVGAGATISDGKFVATVAGTYTVTATIKYNPKKFTGITKTVENITCEIVVSEVAIPHPVTGVIVAPTSVTIKQGATTTLTATVAPSNADDPSVTWSSDNESVATVVNGVVTAVAAGTANITVTTVDGGFTATCAVKVKPLQYTFYAINTAQWPTVAAHYWGGADGGSTWPGADMVKESETINGFDIYSITISSDFINIMFTNQLTGDDKNKKTADLTTEGNDGKYYIYNYDGKSDWYTKEEAEALLAVPVVEETVYFVNNKKWTKVQAYAWNSTGNNTWPGVALTATGEKVEGFDVYSYTAPQGYVNVIFNNKTGDNGEQSADFVWTNGKYYYMDAANNYAGGTKEEVAVLVAPDPLATGVYLAGDMTNKDNWDVNKKEFKKATAEATTASVTVTLAAQTYKFKLVVGGAWKGNTGKMERGGDAVQEGGWSFDKDGYDDNCQIVADIAGDYTFTWNLTEKKLTVTYPPLLKHQVTATVNPAETGTVTGIGEYEQGSTATLVAAPAANYAFKNWTEGGEEVSTEATYSFKVTKAVELVANFVPEETHEVTVSYLCNATPIPGQTTQTLAVGITTPSTITAPTIKNYKFDSWTLGTGVQSENVTTANPIQITTLASGEYTLAANYTKIELTYNVTVPAGTEKCYIAGDMTTEWSFVEMTKVDDTHFTITIEGATADDKYKYAAGPAWAYVEKKADGSEAGDRTYNANDVVKKWASVYDPSATYVLMGVNGDWDNGIALEVNPHNAAEYRLLCQPIVKANDAIKVVKISKGNKSYCANIAGGSVATEYDGNGNIVLADGIYDFYYKIHEDKIYIATATNCYTRDVTEGKYGTICLPKAATNCNGATFFEVAGKDGDKVFFDEVTTLEAGVPYVFLAEAKKIVLSQTGESADEAGYSNSLQGTFSQIDPAEDNILKDNYMVVNNVIKKCGANCGLEANRAYFIATDLENLGTPSARVPGRKRIAMGTTGAQVATGMENVDASAQPVKTIINGQLFILRGEKMYDAQGKLVK